VPGGEGGDSAADSRLPGVAKAIRARPGDHPSAARRDLFRRQPVVKRRIEVRGGLRGAGGKTVRDGDSMTGAVHAAVAVQRTRRHPCSPVMIEPPRASPPDRLPGALRQCLRCLRRIGRKVELGDELGVPGEHVRHRDSPARAGWASVPLRCAGHDGYRPDMFGAPVAAPPHDLRGAGEYLAGQAAAIETGIELGGDVRAPRYVRFSATAVRSPSCGAAGGRPGRSAQRDLNMPSTDLESHRVRQLFRQLDPISAIWPCTQERSGYQLAERLRAIVDQELSEGLRERVRARVDPVPESLSGLVEQPVDSLPR
jgi:hypothetical protein